MVQTFLRGEPAIVLQTEADKEVDFPVGHVYDLLDGSLGLVVMGQERQFAGQFRIDGPIDEAKERFRYISVLMRAEVPPKKMIE